MKNKIALITGASRGIGAEVAKEYARRGAHVILVARSVAGLEEVDDAIQSAGGESTLVPLDLKEHDLIDKLGATINERWGKLDILVGNAAMIGNLTPVSHIVPKQWGEIISTNLTANYRLIRSMHPLLSVAENPRALFVTAEVAKTHTPYWGAYAASKAGLEILVNTYADENPKIDVKLINPGNVRTRLRQQAFPADDIAKLKNPEDVVELFL